LGHAKAGTVLHRIDARLKLAVALGFIVWVVATPIRWWPCYLVQASLLLFWCVAGRLSVRSVLLRVGAVLPVLAMIALAVPLSRGFAAGWDLAGQIMIRAVLALGCAVVLASTTPFPALLNALAWFRLPATFLSILTLMHRYLFVLLEELRRMRRAKQARTCHPDWRTDLVIMANCVGILFVRAFERAERVYAAMCARGWQGRFPD